MISYRVSAEKENFINFVKLHNRPDCISAKKNKFLEMFLLLEFWIFNGQLHCQSLLANQLHNISNFSYYGRNRCFKIQIPRKSILQRRNPFCNRSCAEGNVEIQF